ncbi:MAG TPA: bifunctional DNA-formamidopyrimidine glycosylase/DNA-(apurinic or apyrimidinic site) lyase [Anaerolineales bacterium]|nr:bifunctional DNA-formamidopyrimidine glycosylase/DNA-(apurinic or apyrimidinic site) lyase [Anaerolineales bacterium]
MPELPEVETIVRKLKPDLVGKMILGADLRWPRTLASPVGKKFKERIEGQKIRDVSRRAKYFILHLSSSRDGFASQGNASSLLIHLRMSGDLFLRESKIRPEKHDRLILRLSGNMALVFNDTRKFGRVWLTTTPEMVLGKLGPEPLSRNFTSQWLHAALHNRHRQLKPLLLDQTFLAGLGNIYTDEALHIAKLHPLAASDAITADQAEALQAAVRAVLKEGIRRNGASIDWVYRGGEFQNHFRVYDRAGKPCPVCGTIIERMVVGQRSTHYCPQCQVR